MDGGAKIVLNTDKKRAAACAWLDRHKLSAGWCIVSAGFRLKDKAAYVVLYATDKKDEYWWCVNCNGNGHYFTRKKDLKHYMWDNGYCKDLREKNDERNKKAI